MYLLELVVKNSYSHKHTVIHFKEGINWLLGENESGKTELLDIICYAITGSGLRLNISEYKDLYVSLVFRVKGKVLKVERGKSTHLFEVADDLSCKKIATSKSAVNKHIADLLGYGYSVFSSLNYSKQLEGIALTSAKNSERLNLINKINGVDEANAFEKVLDIKRKDFKSQLKALDTGNILDTLSFKEDLSLEPFATEEELELLSSKSVSLYQEIKELSKIVTHFKMLPKKQVVTKPEVLEILQDSSEETLYEIINTFKVSKIQSEESLALVTKLTKEYEDLLENKPSYLLSVTDVDTYESIHRENLLYYKQEEFLDTHKTTCPNCTHVFIDAGLTNPYTLKSLPCLEQVYLDSKQYYKKYNINSEDILKTRLKEATTSLEAIQSKLDTYPSILKQNSPEELTKQIRDYIRVTDSNSSYEKQVKDFVDLYKVSLGEASTLEQKLNSLEKESAELSLLKENVSKYLSLKKVYELAKKTQDKTDEEISVLKDKIEVLEKILEKSKDIRLQIQNTCIPALNTIASKMINKLTGGKRYGLTMNNTFELTLDGKPISAYSGSTVVLANVAFRLSLIEMFYKKSFPVFIGDEIDAYADDNRAQHIQDALARLEKEGYQMILVSHHSLNFKGNKINLADVKNKGSK